jgi:SNF2 family DNA or RNA helicase
MSYMTSQTFKTFKVMSDVFVNSLTSQAPGVEPPADALKVTLRSHQQAALYRMEQLERSLVNGLDCSGETLYSSYGILGDSVGVGKSLMVLAHISRLATIPPLTNYMSMGASSSNNVFSIKQSAHTDLSEAGSLIIVPHTLFRQWADYIKKQTNLKAIYLDKKKAITSETFTRDVMGADVVLVSNTQYKEFGVWQRDNQVRWKRLFVDEADTIHVVNGYPRPETRFTWFITASWMNILFVNETLYINTSVLQNHLYNEESQYKYLRPFFQEAYNSTRPYTYFRYGMTSYNFFRDTINGTHRLRGRLVMRCDDAFIQESISLPVLHRANILCKAPLNQRIVSMAVPAEVQQLLHGGDVAGAISALGVKTESTTNLIDAVTKNLQKELARLKATYTFKAGLEYSTPQGKEEALKSLEEKMKRAEDAIKTIQERIEGFKNEMCPICYDEPSEPLLTPCCSRIFCGQCILTCLTRNPACPMCRAEIPINRLTKVASTKDATAIVDSGTEGDPEDSLEKKSDALMRIFKDNPQGRFLVFSRYDNPFIAMESTIEAIGVKVKQLKGNKDAVASTLRGFQSGDLRCLLLNSHYAGSGLNITAATHVILLHAMTHEEEKQILGRAYRMGRTEPLNFIRLLHADEMPTTN